MNGSVCPSVCPSVINSRANIHVTIDCSAVLPSVLGVVTRQKPQFNGSVVLGADESPWPCGTPSWYTPPYRIWFWVSRRNFIYFHHNTFVLFSKMSVCLSVRHTFLTMFPSSYHHEISGVITSDKSDVHAKGRCKRSKVKVTEVMTPCSRFRTVTPVWIHILQWNDAYSLMLLRRGALLFFKVIRQISRSHR